MKIQFLIYENLGILSNHVKSLHFFFIYLFYIIHYYFRRYHNNQQLYITNIQSRLLLILIIILYSFENPAVNLTLQIDSPNQLQVYFCKFDSLLLDCLEDLWHWLRKQCRNIFFSGQARQIFCQCQPKRAPSSFLYSHGRYGLYIIISLLQAIYIYFVKRIL